MQSLVGDKQLRILTLQNLQVPSLVRYWMSKKPVGIGSTVKTKFEARNGKFTESVGSILVASVFHHGGQS